MSETKLEAYFFTSILIIVLVLTARLFYPFLGALTLSLVLASLGMPLYTFFYQRLKRGSISALLVVLVMTVAILVPASLLLSLLVDEVSDLTHAASRLNVSDVNDSLTVVETYVHTFIPLLQSVDIGSAIQSGVSNIGSHALTLVSSTADAIFKLFIVVFSLYYFLKDGHRFTKQFVELSPLSDNEDRKIIEKLRVVSRSLIRGTFLIAILQGALTGIGFVLFGIPNPVLWGFVAAIGSLIPTLGTAIVAVPAVLYLILTHNIASAIGLSVWGLLIVGFADNIVRPYLIGSDTHIHPLFVLLSVLGGLSVFGVSGFLLGPLIFGLLLALSEIYKVKIKQLHSADRAGHGAPSTK